VADAVLAEMLLEVTATLATECVCPGLHGVPGRLRLCIALDQCLNLALDLGGDLRFPQPVQGHDPE
jgi:hypothetical protein